KCYSQTDSLKNHSAFFIQSNFMVGKIVANYSDFPKSTGRKTLYLDFGFYDNRKNNSTSRYYNFPASGISLSYSSLGNDSVFGREMDLVPFIDFNACHQLKNSFHFRFGIGASYFTKHYNRITNPTDEPIGSSVTWAFEAFIFQNVFSSKHLQVKAGAGFLHSSNGHTQLPNFGINSAMLSLSFQYFTKPITAQQTIVDRTIPTDRTLHFILQSRFGIGYHEFGGTTGPTGGPKKLVYTESISGGLILKQHVKLRLGFSYRFYEHYYEYILRNPLATMENHPEKILSAHPVWNSSALTFIGSGEFLYNHFGLDLEGGINISKPFYHNFNRLYENDAQPFYFLKSFFATRMGLNYYFISAQKNPKNNFFIGAHINANFGQADFSELSCGYVFRVK
ncbi:MAG TPA: hypothetical protein DCQ93_07685, partial [Bacteroidetes bacterium]|nr:hypothetical protein [Bacteroidota bacterium]